MIFTTQELHYLAAWSREVLENDWTGPAHRLRKTHAAREMDLITLIAAWASVNRKPDVAIADLAPDTTPAWPWNSVIELRSRAEEAIRLTRETSDNRSVRVTTAEIRN